MSHKARLGRRVQVSGSRRSLNRGYCCGDNRRDRNTGSNGDVCRFLGKRAQMKFFVALLIAFAGFLVVLGTFNLMISMAKEKSAEQLCRSSVALREWTRENTPSAVLPPLACTTIDKGTIPLNNKNQDREGVKKEMAEMSRWCWWQFGNGLVENVFNNWFFEDQQNSCFVCYTFKLDEVTGFGIDEPMREEEFEQFLHATKIDRNKRLDDMSDKEKSSLDATYSRYIERDNGLIVLAPKSREFKPNEEIYAVALVSPKYLIDEDWYKSAVDFFFNYVTQEGDTAKHPYVLYTELSNIENICEMQKDVKGD